MVASTGRCNRSRMHRAFPSIRGRPVRLAQLGCRELLYAGHHVDHIAAQTQHTSEPPISSSRQYRDLRTSLREPAPTPQCLAVLKACPVRRAPWLAGYHCAATADHAVSADRLLFPAATARGVRVSVLRAVRPHRWLRDRILLLRWHEMALPMWRRPPAPPTSPSKAVAAAGTLLAVSATRSPR
jgi:hypothetical protein